MKNKPISFWGNKRATNSKPTKRRPQPPRPVRLAIRGLGNPLAKPNIKKKDMNWKQAKKRYPRLHPFADTDKDKVRNYKDCKPFDIKRQGWAHGNTVRKNGKVIKGSIRMMTPDKFLRTSYHEQLQRDNFVAGMKKPEYKNFDKESMRNMQEYTTDSDYIRKVKRAIKSKKEKVVLPKLIYGQKGRKEFEEAHDSYSMEKTGQYYYDTSKERLNVGRASLPRKKTATTHSIDTGHDGRHRAIAAKELGMKLIPVAVYGKETNIKGVPEMTIKEQKSYGKPDASALAEAIADTQEIEAEAEEPEEEPEVEAEAEEPEAEEPDI